jgi:ubiquinone/menaquinone biosynthesis C-methylase UbiE
MDEQMSSVIAHHDWWAETYDDDVSSMTLYNRITLDNIKRFLPEDKDALVLDAGGGTGLWAVEVAKLGYKVVLTDISTGMLDKARNKVASLGLEDRIRIRVSDIRSMPEFAEGEFGMIICEGDPLSYCGDHQAAVREFSRVLRSGGTVVASVDNLVSALNWLRDETDMKAILRVLETGNLMVPNAEGRFPYVVHAFTSEELKRLFESNGFTIERVIGKPTIARRLALYDSDESVIREWLYGLELRYCDNPAFYPLAGHLEIAARKQ